jgi:hypothetical protein
VVKFGIKFDYSGAWNDVSKGAFKGSVRGTRVYL